MSGETTITTATGWLNASQLSLLTAPYAIDPNPAQLHVRTEMTPPGTAVHSFSRETKDTALSSNITEASGLANTAWDTDSVNATVAEWGVLRQLTKKAERINLYGPQGLQARMVTDGTAMCYERLETLIWAEWANPSTSAGVSGAAMTLSDIGSAFAQHAVNKSIGNIVFMLTATQAKNVRNEALSSGAAFLSDGSGSGILRQNQPGGYVGSILGAELFSNNLAASSGANKLGCAMIDAGPGQPLQNGATAVSVCWAPESFTIGNATFGGGAQVAVTMCAGMVEVLDYAYVKLATLA